MVDTRGINVWCAAGKGTFCAAEIAYQVRRAELDKIVSHRQLILPQLGAAGVVAHEVKGLCGFRALFGPVRIEDLHRFLLADWHADKEMRTVTFSLAERVTLIPVELVSMLIPLAIVTSVVCLFSGIGPDIYAINRTWTRGLQFLLATLGALMAGTVLTPVFLPWLPGRQFWLKGIIAGLAALPILYILMPNIASGIDLGSLMLWHISLSSYLAMNFTGSTPYTSLSGVETEMKRGLLFQIFSAIAALLLWFSAPFLTI